MEPVLYHVLRNNHLQQTPWWQGSQASWGKWVSCPFPCTAFQISSPLYFGNWYSLPSTHGLQWIASPVPGPPQIWLTVTCLNYARSHWLLVTMWHIIFPSFNCTVFRVNAEQFWTSKPHLGPELWDDDPALQRPSVSAAQQTVFLFLLIYKKVTINPHDLYTTFINFSKRKSGLWEIFDRLVSYINV